MPSASPCRFFPLFPRPGSARLWRAGFGVSPKASPRSSHAAASTASRMSERLGPRRTRGRTKEPSSRASGAGRDARPDPRDAGATQGGNPNPEIRKETTAARQHFGLRQSPAALSPLRGRRCCSSAQAGWKPAMGSRVPPRSAPRAFVLPDESLSPSPAAQAGRLDVCATEACSLLFRISGFGIRISLVPRPPGFPPLTSAAGSPRPGRAGAAPRGPPYGSTNTGVPRCTSRTR